MPSKDPSREEALSRLSQRADALQRSTAKAPNAAVSYAAHGSAVSGAYRIIVELFAGVLVGVGLGFAVGWAWPASRPWSIVAGVLLGFAVSLWMAKRTADRLTAQAQAEQAARGGPPPSAPFDDEEDE